MEGLSGQESDVITRADVESTADAPAALTANLFFCSQCNSVFRQAKILPCLHSFCRKCLVDAVVQGPDGSAIRCPTCHHLTPLPPNGLVGVPDNAFLNRLCQNYLGEIPGNVSDSQQQQVGAVKPTTTTTTAREGRRSHSDRRGQSPRTTDRPTRTEDFSDDDEEEDARPPRDPFASERSLPAGSDQGDDTMQALHNRNKLQAKMMCLQGEALRLTYAVDHINSWPDEWQRRREDLKREIRARSSQLQFLVKRAERALLSQLDEESRAAEHRYVRDGEAGKQMLRASLRSVLHEVNVIKGVRELATDAEVNNMCANLIGHSVGVAEVALDTPFVSLEGGHGKKDEEELKEVIAHSLGKLVFSQQSSDVFRPEYVDYSKVSVEDIASKVEGNSPGSKLASSASMESASPPPVPSAVATTTTSPGASSETPATPTATPNERRSRSKRRHVTDLGLDSPDVRAFLTQLQSARESFRTRRQEILQQGQMGKVGTAESTPSAGTMEAVRARIRSASRESAARASLGSIDSNAPMHALRSSSLSRVGSSPSLVAAMATAATPASKYLSSSAAASIKQQASPRHDGGDFNAPLFLSPQVQRRAAALARGRRHSSDTGITAAAQKITPAEAAKILTSQTGEGEGEGEQGNSGAGTSSWLTSKPLRRAISSGSDKRAKIEILRETWQRRKEMLIQSEGFVTSGRQDLLVGNSNTRRGSEPEKITTGSAFSSHSHPDEKRHADDKVTEDPKVKPPTKLPQVTVRTVQQVSDPAGVITQPFSSLYMSRDTVRMAIPEVSEATSPTPDKRDSSPDPSMVTVETGEVIVLPRTTSGTETVAKVGQTSAHGSFSSSREGLDAKSGDASKKATETTVSTSEDTSSTTTQSFFFKSRLTGQPVQSQSHVQSISIEKMQSVPGTQSQRLTSNLTQLPVTESRSDSSANITTSGESVVAQSRLSTTQTIQPMSQLRTSGRDIEKSSARDDGVSQTTQAVTYQTHSNSTQKRESSAISQQVAPSPAIQDVSESEEKTKANQDSPETETWTTTTEVVYHTVPATVETTTHKNGDSSETFNTKPSEKPESPTTTTSTFQTVTSNRPFFRSRLTGLPVGGTPANTDERPSQPTMPFFKSRLTGQPVGLTTSRVSSQTNTSTGSQESSNYSSRFSTRAGTTESRSYTPSDNKYKSTESVDVASLIAAMYSGHEKQIISTKSESATTTTTTASAASSTTSTVSSTSTITTITTTNSTSRELPPLRSAPAFSYSRRYNMLSTSQTQPPSSATGQEEKSKDSQSSGSDASTLRSETQSYSLTSRDDSQGKQLTSSGSSGGTSLLTSTVYTSQVETKLPSFISSKVSEADAEDIRSKLSTRSLVTSTRVEPKLSPVVSRRHTVEVGHSIISEAMASQSEHRHLPDVIPETSNLRLREETWTRPETQTQAVTTGPGVSQYISDSSGSPRPGELLKKAYGLDVDSDLTRGMSLTDAIRKSDPAYKHYMSSDSSASTARAVPEPLDLTGVKTLPISRSPARSPARSPRSPLSPAVSPTEEQGIRGRLKEIARKKKERWRNLTIN